MSRPETVVRTQRLEDGDLTRVEVTHEGLRVEVLAGPDQGLEVTLALPLIRIGKGPENDLVLTDPSVSRRHAQLEQTEAGWVLTDLGSTNGTWLGAARVEKVELRDAAEVGLGDTRVRVGPGQARLVGLADRTPGLHGVLGASPAMLEVFALIRALAPARTTVLVQGESGTGKELVARALHDESRRHGPLVTFDCALTDPAMIRSELFGHQKGAFTGADKDRAGAFQQAEGGTLFLDEVGELPLDLQPRLLRVLESRTVQPLGAEKPRPVDVRVVAATHRDLEAMVAAGRFRADLYHRLAVLPMRLPPLRDRGDDVLLLARHLLAQAEATCSLGPEAEAALAAYPWPGNVRELRNKLERARLLTPSGAIPAAALDLSRAAALDPAGAAPTPVVPPGAAPAPLDPASPAGAPPPGAPGSLAAAGAQRRKAREQAQYEELCAALDAHDWNRGDTAAALGISPATLWRRMKKYGLLG